MKVWTLTYEDTCEFDGVFSSRERARQALRERIKNSETIEDFHLCGSEEDFELYHFRNSYEDAEAIIQERELDKVY